MPLESLPPKTLLLILKHLHSLEDLHSLFSTSRTLYRTCGNPPPKIIPRLAANSGRVFFRPHPHLLLAFTARQLADWAITSHDNRFLLETAIQGGVETLLQLAIEVAELSMDDIRRIYAYKSDVLNPLDRRLDLSAGPASQDNDFLTVCNDPETALLNWIIYGELFHHSHELSYLPLPQHKPLSSVTRFKWFVYCIPDINSFNYHKFEGAHALISQLIIGYDEDRFPQLSMQHAIREFMNESLWRPLLETSPSFQDTPDPTLFVSAAMHMGLKSLELLIPGGVEKLAGDLEQINSGLQKLRSEHGDDPEKRLRQAAGDPWLPYAHITLKEDLRFALWGDWQYDAVYSDSEDEDSQNESLDDWYNSHGLQAFESKLSERIRSPPQREDFALQGVGHQVLRVASVSQSSFIHSTD